nr:ribonuclease H-like domain-containing protein [Tanacetum cinerariifolium]
MSANDKFGLGYGDYRYGSILSYENEVLHSVFMNKECDLEDTPANNRYAERMHAVSPPMTGNYMPSGPDVEIDYSKFTYGPKQTPVDESDAKTCENASSESESSVETTTSMPAPVENVPKIICEHKVWIDAPIIEEYESDSNDDSVSNVKEKIEKPSFAFIDFVEHVKSPRKNIKETDIPNHIPKIEKHDRYGHTRKGLGYAFTKKACFVCGSFSHIIRDCNFHEKRMAKQAVLTKSKTKVTGQRENKPVWNNVQRDDPHKALKDKGIVDGGCSTHMTGNKAHLTFDDPHKALKDKGIIDSGCSTHMTGNKAHLTNYQEFKGGSVAFGRSNGRITGKRKDKSWQNKVLFTDTDCLVLSPYFKLPNENQVLLKIPRQHNMYSFNLMNIDPGDLSCLFAKALIDESNN